MNHLEVPIPSDESNSINSNENEALLAQQNNKFYKNGYFSYNACPTCKGSGKISKEEKNELIALIPISDARLKPRRIWLWILITIVVCVLIAVLLSYLFAPRELTITNDLVNLPAVNLTRIYDLNNETIGLVISFKDTFYIENNNYFAIKLINVQLEINRNSHSIEPKIKYDQNMVLRARHREMIDVYVYYSIYSEDDPYANFCLNGLIKNLFSLIKTTFTFQTIWSANLQTHLSLMQYIGCQQNKNSSNA